MGRKRKAIKIKESEYRGDIKCKGTKLKFLNKKGCIVYGYVEADEIESKGPLTAVNIRAYDSINVRGLLKSKQFIIAEGSIIINGSIVAGWSIYSGVWIRAKGFIIAKKGSISATEYIISDRTIMAHSWVTCDKKIEAGHSIWAGEYIKTQEISVGEKSEGDFSKQTIKAKRIKGEILTGTVIP
jgi:hypothetical protein